MAWILAAVAASMIPALLIAVYDGQPVIVKSFLITILLTAVISAFFAYICRNASSAFSAREGLICTSSAWIIISLLGALPFWFSGGIPRYIDALFETVSGFTTTGASILVEVDPMARGLLYWRSFTHWLGGMGVLVFILTLASVKGSNSGVTLHLLRAESPGPEVEKIVPQMRKNSMILYGIYCALTILDVLFLMFGGMSLFESVCTAYGTAGTGGFSVHSTSIAEYSSYIQIVTTVFMMLFGVNFSLYYMLLLKKIRPVLKNAELRLYLCIIAVSTVLVTINVHNMYTSAASALKHSAFQVASIITTTGYATTDFDRWPAFSKAILLILMAIGACAGSTGGGLKCSRVIILIKSFIRNIKSALYPQRVSVIRFSGTTLQEKTVDRTASYLIIYVFIAAFSFLVISIDGFDLETNISAVFACFNNVGPGFSAVGPTMNYSDFSILSKVILILDMLAGRLEIIPITALFAPSVWRRR